jgi:hypothetical protein
MDITKSQMDTCQKYGAQYAPLDPALILGISDNFFSGEVPLNGLRHPPEGSTCGWYLWAGEELSDADDFFKPMHAAHLIERCPEIVRFLGLPAGWRFLVADAYEDVWFDSELLEI